MTLGAMESVSIARLTLSTVLQTSMVTTVPISVLDCVHRIWAILQIRQLGCVSQDVLATIAQIIHMPTIRLESVCQRVQQPIGLMEHLVITSPTRVNSTVLNPIHMEILSQPIDIA